MPKVRVDIERKFHKTISSNIQYAVLVTTLCRVTTAQGMKLIIYIFKDGQRTIALLSASIHKLAVYGWQLKPFLDTQVAAVHLPWGATTSIWESSRIRIFRSTWESDRLSWGLPRFFLSDWTLGHNNISDRDQAIKREIKLLNEQLRLVNINSPGAQSGWIWGGRTGSLFPQKVKNKKGLYLKCFHQKQQHCPYFYDRQIKYLFLRLHGTFSRTKRVVFLLKVMALWISAGVSVSTLSGCSTRLLSAVRMSKGLPAASWGMEDLSRSRKSASCRS